MPVISGPQMGQVFFGIGICRDDFKARGAHDVGFPACRETFVTLSGKPCCFSVTAGIFARARNQAFEKKKAEGNDQTQNDHLNEQGGRIMQNKRKQSEQSESDNGKENKVVQKPFQDYSPPKNYKTFVTLFASSKVDSRVRIFSNARMATSI